MRVLRLVQNTRQLLDLGDGHELDDPRRLPLWNKAEVLLDMKALWIHPGDLVLPIVDKADDEGLLRTARVRTAQPTSDHLSHEDGRDRWPCQEDRLHRRNIDPLGQDVDVDEHVDLSIAKRFDGLGILLGGYACARTIPKR